MKSLNLIKKYVPRHFRLGRSCELPTIKAFQDVVESVPVVDDSGSVVYSKTVVKSVPADEVMRKYRISQFRLSALVKAGVPLKVVNVNSSNVATIEHLKNVCDSIESANSYVEKVLAQRKERESWLQPEQLTEV